MPTLRRPDVTLHYEESGPRDAPAVVLGHSLLCDGTMFAHLAAALSARYRVLNLDLRGHGRSSPSRRAYTLEDQASDVVALLDQARVDRAHLVGLSMGAMTALRVALWHPTRVASLALMDTSAEPEAPTRRVRYLALAAIARVVGARDALAAQVLPLMFSDGYLAREPEAVRAFVRSLQAMDRRALAMATRAVADRGDVLADLGEITAPALVVVGREDRATPVFRAERIARALRGARLTVVDGAGHLSTVEQPEVTTEAVRTFLDGL